MFAAKHRASEPVKGAAPKQQEGWISIHDSLPDYGQRIVGRSPRGEWTENFDPYEGLGAMTHWKPA